jgi:IclR family KDG regulon transcriptional repressor
MDSTVLKAMAVLETLAASDRPCRITDLARELNLAKSNTHRLLKTLETLGYVRQRPDNALYEATLRLWELGVRVLDRLDVRRIARPYLEALADRSSEAAHLSRFDAGEVVYLDKIESIHPVRAYTQIGGRAPAYCTATGKALLAFQPDPTIAMVAAQLTAFTPRTLTDPKALLVHLETIRRQGYAINQGEWRASVYGLAAPVFDGTGAVVAAVGISGLGERLKIRALRGMAPPVMQAAAAISSELGFKAQQTAPAGGVPEAGRMLEQHRNKSRIGSAGVIEPAAKNPKH